VVAIGKRRRNQVDFEVRLADGIQDFVGDWRAMSEASTFFGRRPN
jgi:hypothetical protein